MKQHVATVFFSYLILETLDRTDWLEEFYFLQYLMTLALQKLSRLNLKNTGI